MHLSTYYFYNFCQTPLAFPGYKIFCPNNVPYLKIVTRIMVFSLKYVITVCLDGNIKSKHDLKFRPNSSFAGVLFVLLCTRFLYSNRKPQSFSFIVCYVTLLFNRRHFLTCFHLIFCLTITGRVRNESNAIPVT